MASYALAALATPMIDCIWRLWLPPDRSRRMSHRSPRTAEQTVALVVSFSTVRFCPDEKPLPVTVIDPLETPVGGSTLTIGLDAAEEVPDIDATASSGATSSTASSILR